MEYVEWSGRGTLRSFVGSTKHSLHSSLNYLVGWFMLKIIWIAISTGVKWDKLLSQCTALMYNHHCLVNMLTRCLREPGGPCVKPMGIKESSRERVNDTIYYPCSERTHKTDQPLLKRDLTAAIIMVCTVVVIPSVLFLEMHVFSQGVMSIQWPTHSLQVIPTGVPRTSLCDEVSHTFLSSKFSCLWEW